MKELNDLTDFEIEKYIAKIEGINNPNAYGSYRPLTDKALCFDLMVKYGVVFSQFGGKCRASLNWSDDVYINDIINKDPQRAICLAIIAQHRLKGGTE